MNPHRPRPTNSLPTSEERNAETSVYTVILALAVFTLTGLVYFIGGY